MVIAVMTAGDLAAVIVAMVALMAVVAISVVLASLVRSLKETRRELAAFRETVGALLSTLETTIVEAQHDLERVDDLVGSAEALASTVDSAARVGYLAVGRPVIKTVALAKGTSRAARRLRSPKAG